MPVTNDAFDAIDHYTFSQPSYERLYETLKTVRESSVSVTEASDPAYYGNVYRFYDQLRNSQILWKQRADAGEDPDVLEQELWELFKTIPE